MYIAEFKISGYRSLKDIHIKEMLPVCIFHGLNNSGKSNILSAIETIFCRKELVQDVIVDKDIKDEQVKQPSKRVGPFWKGRINGFRDNFYLNGKDDIEFTISIAFKKDSELNFLKDVLKYLKTQNTKILTLSGRIRYVDNESADMILEHAVFNGRLVVYEADGEKKSFFPVAEKISQTKRVEHFDALMDMLADSFALLPSDRYLTSEKEAKEPIDKLPLTPKTFKQWLFMLSLSRDGHEAFEEIKGMFGNTPFSFGKIGFSREKGEIEIMVEEKTVRLPISRLGSGYQQILYIIANLVLNKKKMMGIEELEINLSPTAQKMVFEKLKHHINDDSDLVSQIIITSHSDYFGGRSDVRCYSVEHNGSYTSVKPWSKVIGKKFFSSSSGAWSND